MKTRQCVLTQPDNMRSFHVLLGPHRTVCALIRKHDFNMKEVKGRISSFPLPFCFFFFNFLTWLQHLLCACLSLILFPLLCVHFMLALFLWRQPLQGNFIVKCALRLISSKENGLYKDKLLEQIQIILAHTQLQ